MSWYSNNGVKSSLVHPEGPGADPLASFKALRVRTAPSTGSEFAFSVLKPLNSLGYNISITLLVSSDESATLFLDSKARTA